MMRAFVVSDMLGQKAGCYLATSLLCRELTRLGLRVTCFAQNVDFGEEAIPGSFEIVRPWARRGCRWDWPGQSLSWQARRRIESQKPNYVIVMGAGPLSRYLLQSRVASRLLIWELTNATPGNKFVDSEASRLLKRSRAMLSPSAAIDRGIRETYGYTGPILRLPFWIEDGEGSEVRGRRSEVRGQRSVVRGPWSVVRGQSSPAARARDNGTAGRQDCETSRSRVPVVSSSCGPFMTDFIYLGRRDIEKGLHELVRAAAEVSKQFPGVQVMIAGQGSEEPFAATARELGVTDNIRFQFFRTRKDTMDAMANSRCLVLPSYHEGYPLVLLEAIRVSVPVIATTVGSVPEVFEGSEAALLVPPKDVSSLAGAMRTILSDSSQHYEQRRQAAAELFRKLNSAEAIRARLESLLRQAREL